MSPITWPLAHPVGFWSIAAVVTLYHASRAWVGKYQAVLDENRRRAIPDIVSGRTEPPIPRWQQVFMHQIHDALFHVVCCAGGFAAIYAFVYLFRKIAVRPQFPAGVGFLMIFLAIFGVSGAAGVLPPMLLFGKWPKLFGQSN